MAHSAGLVTCVVVLLLAMANYGVLAWLSATPVSAERLAQIQWRAGAWLLVIVSMLAGCVIFIAGILRGARQ